MGEDGSDTDWPPASRSKKGARMLQTVAKPGRRLLRHGLLLCVLLPALADAQTRLIKDIASGTSSSNPSGAVLFKGKLYFSANDSVNGAELWVSDSTTSGTTLFKDACAGSCSSSPFGATEFAGVLYFFANSTQLWKSDGTAAGTTMVKDLGATPGELKGFDSILYFTTYQAPNGSIWKTDGTNAGTTIITTVGDPVSLATSTGGIYAFQETPNTPSSANENATTYRLTPFGITQLFKSHVISAKVGIDNILYTLSTYTVGASTYSEIRMTEACCGRTTVVVTFASGSAPCSASAAAPIGTLFKSGFGLYFDGCSTGSAGRALWGIGRLLKDFCPAGGGSSPTNFADVNGTLYIHR
jgi:ELWxxDGT repeat protein